EQAHQATKEIVSHIAQSACSRRNKRLMELVAQGHSKNEPDGQQLRPGRCRRCCVGGAPGQNTKDEILENMTRLPAYHMRHLQVFRRKRRKKELEGGNDYA